MIIEFLVTFAFYCGVGWEIPLRWWISFTRRVEFASSNDYALLRYLFYAGFATIIGFIGLLFLVDFKIWLIVLMSYVVLSSVSFVVGRMKH